MNVTALCPTSTSTSIALLDTGAHKSCGQERRKSQAFEDRRERQDRRTEDQVRRRMTYGLEELVWDGTPVPPPARIVAAARLFTEGNAYFTGTLVDRSA